jgi:hypothetical protein
MSDPGRFGRFRVSDVERMVEEYQGLQDQYVYATAVAVFLGILEAIAVYCILMGL